LPVREVEKRATVQCRKGCGRWFDVYADGRVELNEKLKDYRAK